MISPLASRIKRIVKAELTPFLRDNGFHKDGITYCKALDELTWIVDVQQSSWNDRNEARFTINAGVYVHGFASLYSRPDPVKLRVPDSCVSARIGMLSETQRDKWWKITARDDPAVAVDEAIAREVRKWVEGLILPFLAKFKCPEDVAAFLDGSMALPSPFIDPQASSKRFAHASIIYAILGNRPKAIDMIEEALRAGKGKPGEEDRRDLRERILRK